MAAKKRSSGGTNRSEFIRNILNENPQATASDVADAWTAAGHKEELNKTLYYQTRRTMGLSTPRGGSKKRGRKPKAVKAAESTPAPAATNGSTDYLAIEKQIDSLVAQADSIGDSKLAEVLRQARRRVSAKLV